MKLAVINVLLLCAFSLSIKAQQNQATNRNTSVPVLSLPAQKSGEVHKEATAPAKEVKKLSREEQSKLIPVLTAPAANNATEQPLKVAAGKPLKREDYGKTIPVVSLPNTTKENKELPAGKKE